VTLDLGYPEPQEDPAHMSGHYFERAFTARRQADVRHTIEMRF